MMEVAKRERPLWRAIGVVAVGLALMVSAYGPGRVVSALPFHRAPAPSEPARQPGYLVTPVPLVLNADKIRFVDLKALRTNVPIPLTNGAMSPPDTVYVRARTIELDNAVIVYDHGNYKVEIANRAGGDKAARAGLGPDAITDLWITITALKACTTPELFHSVALGYAGVFGGALDSILLLIRDIFAPYLAGPLAEAGPCLPAAALVPLIGEFLKYGVPLPGGTLEVGKGTIPVYAMHIQNAKGASSLTLPAGAFGITQ